MRTVRRINFLKLDHADRLSRRFEPLTSREYVSLGGRSSRWLHRGAGLTTESWKVEFRTVVAQRWGCCRRCLHPGYPFASRPLEVIDIAFDIFAGTNLARTGTDG